MIVNIRGTSGSGKSTLARLLMEKSMEGTVWNGETYRGRLLGSPDVVSVLGRYETACGGCDTIKTQDEIEQRLAKASVLGSVVFEGLLLSTLHSRWRDVARHYNAAYDIANPVMETALGRASKKFPPFVFAFLDTPLEVCIARVKARRLEAGNEKPLNEDGTRAKFGVINKVAKKLEADGLPVVWLDHTDPLPGLLTILAGAEP